MLRAGMIFDLDIPPKSVVSQMIRVLAQISPDTLFASSLCGEVR